MNRMLDRFIAGGGLALLGLAVWAPHAGAAGDVKASLRKDVLNVVGSAGPDTIVVRLQSVGSTMLVVDVGGDGTADYAFDRSKLTTVNVNGNGGDDTLIVDPVNGGFTDAERTTLDGGDGNDRLVGANFGETLAGGSGDDVLDGNGGMDLLSGGNGADTFTWDPGDSSDTVQAGGGIDRLAFNGANIGERFAFSNAAGHVRVTRDVATVALDLDDLETVDLRAANGADVITLDDLNGTDLTRINADLAPALGGDDLAADEIVTAPGAAIGRDSTVATVTRGAQLRIVNPGAGDLIHVVGTSATETVGVAGTEANDVVSVTADGTDVRLDGVTAVPIKLAAVDVLDLDLGAGDDSSSAVGNLAALIALDIDGGPGNDTLLGGNGADLLTGGPGADFVDGNQGADVLRGGDGDDVVQWDPGDGSDTTSGGTASDRLIVNGANIGEFFDFAAVADHVRLTRNIGNVVLDLAEIDVLDLRTLGGADVVNLNDLTGTDLARVDADMAAVGGADDAVADTVTAGPGVSIGRDDDVATLTFGARLRVLHPGTGDSIRVTGGGAADTVHLAGTAGDDAITVVSNGTDIVVQGATAAVPVNLTTVELLDVDLGDGGDSFSAVGNLATLIALDVDGGDGNDTLLGGNGADTIAGGPGTDFVDGNQGNDTVSAGDGDDDLQWDPGDGNDTLVGGAGRDRLTFNGSNANEIFDIAAAGGHVSLARNVAGILLDLDDVEALDLRASGGADVVHAGSAFGTDLTEVMVDLALFGGGDDLQIDAIGVPTTAVIGGDGGAAVVTGLGAEYRVINGAPTDRIQVTGGAGQDIASIPGTAGNDTVAVTANGTDVAVQGLSGVMFVNLTAVERLDVDLGDGGDSFSAVGNLAILIALDVDGGDGNDTLLGGNGADTIAGGPGTDFLDGNQGMDALAGGDGDDTVQWDPGDGSDTVTGGAGIDRLVFNASNAGELVDMVQAAGHVRLTRNIGTVGLDLVEIDAIDLRMLAGNDSVTIGDLTGTDVREVGVDLGAFGGVVDTVADAVTVRGTSVADTITVADQGSDVVVQGLPATVRIAHADATLDGLTVDGLEGEDQISATPGAQSLILLSVLP